MLSFAKALGASLILLAAAGFSNASDSTSDALAVFEQRIMPIFKSANPSSCVQCHLASVDIKDYILPSHVDTFVALREQELINVEDPEASKILQLIQRGEDDLDAMSRRIHAKTREAEYEAFAAWIKACCSDTELVAMTADAKPVGPKRELEVIRHTRKSQLLVSFEEKVWSQLNALLSMSHARRHRS